LGTIFGSFKYQRLGFDITWSQVKEDHGC